MLRTVMGACVIAILNPALWAGAAGIRVTVSAGDADRIDTPVNVELPLPPDQMGLPIGVVADGRAQPAQIEPLDGGKARVWWILDRLPAGQTRTFQIRPGLTPQMPDEPAFAWKDSSQGKVKSKDLCLAGRPVLRYMYTPFDGSSKEAIEITKKPYYHVYDPDGSRIITKGEGGRYPHHRGIFYGHNRVKVGGQTLDIWSANEGEHQLHTRFVREFAGPVFGGHVVTVDWIDRQGKTFATETRRVLAFRSPAGESLIEFETTIVTAGAPVALESSNNHHGGVQFRADSAVADNEKDTRFLRPGRWATMPADAAVGVEEHPDFKNLPWNAIQFRLGDRAYTVADLCHPMNPRPAEFSERAYGRFGEYSTWRLERKKPLTLAYRFWVTATHAVKAADVDRRARDFVSPPRASAD